MPTIRKKAPECPGLDGPDEQIEKIRQNYLNESIDQETFEQALEDVFAGKPNSYGEAVYDNDRIVMGGLPPIKPKPRIVGDSYPFPIPRKYEETNNSHPFWDNLPHDSTEQ